VLTPRGGKHRYFAGELPTYVGKGELAHVDTRGRGSYALLPPSRTADGTYSVADPVAVAPLPDWFLARIEASKTKPTRLAGDATVELDRPQAVRRGEDYLRTLAPIAERAGADEATYAAACHLRDLGISHGLAENMMLEMLQIAPWDADRTPDFIRFKTENAYRYATNDAGVRAPPQWEKVMRSLPVEPTPEEKAETRKKSRFWPRDEREMDSLGDPTWMIPELMPDICTMLMLGESGSLKSFLALDIAMAIAAGVPSCFGMPVRPGPVFYGALEGLWPLATLRRKAWRASHAGVSVPDFFVMPGPLLAQPDDVEEFGSMIDWKLGPARRCSLIVIDTTARAMSGLDENSAKDVGIMVQAVDSLRDAFQCPVLLLHHLGKDKHKMGRGSGALYGAMDTVVSVDRPNEFLPVVSMKVKKQKDAEERSKPWYLEGTKIAGSLAMKPLDVAAWETLTSPVKQFDRLTVGRALRLLEAFSGTRTVTTMVLALEVMIKIEGEPAEARLKRAEDACRALTKLARDHSSQGLSAYYVGDNAWAVPPLPT
jgi:hypothetical protein